jgi:hypothetical protein
MSVSTKVKAPDFLSDWLGCGFNFIHRTTQATEPRPDRLLFLQTPCGQKKAVDVPVRPPLAVTCISPGNAIDQGFPDDLLAFNSDCLSRSGAKVSSTARRLRCLKTAARHAYTQPVNSPFEAYTSGAVFLETLAQKTKFNVMHGINPASNGACI